MSNFDKKIIDKYWLEVSDLTIFEAAFWMLLGDPLNHNRFYPTKDDDLYVNDIDDLRHIGEDICDRDIEWRIRTDEKGEVIASAIRAGTIKTTEVECLDKKRFDFKRTRINKSDWLDWCRNIGYVSLADSFTPTSSNSKGKSFPNKTPSSSDWKAQAREIADECFDHDTEMNCRDSLKNYANRVMGLMRERGIKGPRGIIDNPNTIMREALQGKKWWANKSK